MDKSTRSFFLMCISGGLLGVNVHRAVSDCSVFSSFMAGFIGMVCVYWSAKMVFDLKKEAQ